MACIFTNAGPPRLPGPYNCRLEKEMLRKRRTKRVSITSQKESIQSQAERSHKLSLEASKVANKSANKCLQASTVNAQHPRSGPADHAFQQQYSESRVRTFFDLLLKLHNSTLGSLKSALLAYRVVVDGEMSKKRPREQDSVRKTSSKRPRINEALVETWNRLGDEDEAVRLRAAHTLIEHQLSQEDPQLSRQIARRLFRGLCSGRKGARLGFYTALVAAIAMRPAPFGDATTSIGEVLSLLESETAKEPGTYSQEERDHAFGRLLGCKAIIDSGILFRAGKETLQLWERLLEVQCVIAAKKPWLRQESGWILFECVQKLGSRDSGASFHGFALAMIGKLQEHKLMRSPEGVAIWIAIQKSFPKLSLPHGVWKYDNPLSTKDLKSLAQILKESRSHEEDFEIQGNLGWSAQLHFSWQEILHHIFKDRGKGEATFGAFWEIVVDKGLFGPERSAERKHLGLLLLQWMVQEAPEEFLAESFTINATACFIGALSPSTDRYLRSTAQTLKRSIVSVGQSQAGRATILIRCLILGWVTANFETTTLNEILDSLGSACTPKEEQSVQDLLRRLLHKPCQGSDFSLAPARRGNILNFQQRLLTQFIMKVNSDGNDAGAYFQLMEVFLRDLLKISTRSGSSTATEPPFDKPTIELVKAKLSVLLESVLKTGQRGQGLFKHLVFCLENERLSADKVVTETLERGWKRYKTLVNDTNNVNGAASTASNTGRVEAMPLLYALLIYQIHTGDTESVNILEEVTNIPTERYNDERAGLADQVVEILLAILSTPSRFLRRITGMIFEGLSPDITSDGVKSLTEILQTRETRDGQQNLFAEEDANDSQEALENDESVDIGSDVEVHEGSGSSQTSTEESQSEMSSDKDSTASESGNESAESEEPDAFEELDKALASALGTRKLTSTDIKEAGESSDEDSGSDSDMSDSQMIALDEKLAEVFRNQTAQKSRQKESNLAKTSVVNFKNRALDMIESFIGSQHSRFECLETIEPLFDMIMTTTSKQLADRGTTLLKQYAQKCRGKKVPVLKGERDSTKTTAILETVLESSLAKDASNVLIAVGSQITILLCRVLVNAEWDVKSTIRKVEEIIESKGVKGKRKAHDEFIKKFRFWARTVNSKGQQ